MGMKRKGGQNKVKKAVTGETGKKGKGESRKV